MLSSRVLAKVSIMFAWNNWLRISEHLAHAHSCVSAGDAIIIIILLYFVNIQSKRNAKLGEIDVARKQGACAAYLSIAAIASALVIASIATGCALGVYAQSLYYY